VVVPCRNAICSVVLKWTGKFKVVCLALRCDGNIRVYCVTSPKNLAAHQRPRRRVIGWS
jgi:hypothetical protein